MSAVVLALMVPGCAPRILLPPELPAAASPPGPPLHLTWYLSEELRRDRTARQADAVLAALAREVPGLRLEVRSPRPGEERPQGLLPLPAYDDQDRLLLLNDGLVLDQGRHRVVIPDLRQPAYLPLDLLRALEDLKTGAPRQVGIIDGRDSLVAQEEPLPVFLDQRWQPRPFLETSPPPGVLLVLEGPRLPPQIFSSLSTLPDTGIVVFSPNPAGEAKEAYPGFLFLDQRSSLRDLDTALLQAAGRLEVLAGIPQNLPLPRPGSSQAGSRTRRAAPKAAPPLPSFIPEEAAKILLTGAGESAFSLEKEGSLWFLHSDSWQIPAREDRIASFLQQAAEGMEDLRLMEPGQVPREDPRIQGISLRLEDRRGRALLSLEWGRLREAGGGVWVRLEGKEGLWLFPGLPDAVVPADSLYWMERRLFPGLDPREIIRVESLSSQAVVWRLLLENNTWSEQRPDQGSRILSEEEILPYLNKLASLEALSLVPPGVWKEPEQGSQKLRVEDSQGKMRELIWQEAPAGQEGSVLGKIPNERTALWEKEIMEGIQKKGTLPPLKLP